MLKLTLMANKVISTLFISFFFVGFSTASLSKDPNIIIPDSIIKYVDQLDNPKDRMHYLNKQAIALEEASPDASIQLSLTALEIAVKYEFLKDIAQIYNNLGYAHQIKHAYPQATEYFQKAMKRYKMLMDLNPDSVRYKTFFIENLVDLGNSLYYQDLYKQALEAYLKSLDMAVQINDSAYQAKIFNNIGNVFETQNDYAKAFGYLKKALDLKEKLKDKEGLSTSYNNMGSVYMGLNKPDSALWYIEKSLELHRLNNNKAGIALTLTNIASILIEDKKYEKALKHCDEALQLCMALNDEASEASVLVNLGTIKLAQGNFKSAEVSLMKAFSIGNNLKINDLILNSSERLYELFKATGNFQKALYYHEEFKKASETLLNETQSRSITMLEMQYEFNKQSREKEIEYVKREAEMRTEIKNQKIITLLSWLGFVLGSIMVFAFYRNHLIKKRSNKLIKAHQLENEKQKENLRDIAEKAQNAIIQAIESEKKYKRLVESISDQYFFYSRDSYGKYTYVSPSVYSILGCKPNEFYERFEDWIVHNEKFLVMNERSKLAMKGLQQEAYEIEIKAKDGSQKILEILDVPIVNMEGYISGIESIAQDITIRKTAEEKLSKSEQKLSAILSHAAIGIDLVDAEATIFFANDHMANMLGYSKEELIGLKINDITHPDDSDLSHEYLNKLSQGEVGQYRIEKRYQRKDGSEFWADLSVRPMFDAAGSISHVIGVILDINEKKQFEKKLIEREKELIEALSSRDKLFQVIAHDLRGPVGSVKSMVELIHSKPKDFTKTEMTEIISDINFSIRNTYFLLENLLFWARVQRKEMVCNPNYYDIDDMVEEVVEIILMMAQEKGIQVKIAQTERCKAYCDQNMVMFIIRNILTNAIKYSPEKSYIAIRLSKLDAFAELEIADEGYGISAEMLDKILNQRISVSTPGTNKEKGSGLGLLLSLHFIEMQRGTFKIDSLPGKGTRFSFQLPLKQK